MHFNCRFLAVPLFVMVLGSGAPSALAQWASDTVTFTEAEEKVISANEALAKVRKSDPSLVRHALTMLPVLSEAGPKDRTKDMTVDRAGAAPTLTEEEAEFLRRNPAIEKAFRSSPEAAHDLLVLIRNAAKQGTGQSQ